MSEPQTEELANQDSKKPQSFEEFKEYWEHKVVTTPLKYPPSEWKIDPELFPGGKK